MRTTPPPSYSSKNISLTPSEAPLSNESRDLVIMHVGNVNDSSETGSETQLPIRTRTPWVASHKIRQSLSMNISSRELANVKKWQGTDIKKLTRKETYTFLLRAAITLKDSENTVKKNEIKALIKNIVVGKYLLIDNIITQKNDNGRVVKPETADLKTLLSWEFNELFLCLENEMKIFLRSTTESMYKAPSYEEATFNDLGELPPPYVSILNSSGDPPPPYEYPKDDCPLPDYASLTFHQRL